MKLLYKYKFHSRQQWFIQIIFPVSFQYSKTPLNGVLSELESSKTDFLGFIKFKSTALSFLPCDFPTFKGQVKFDLLMICSRYTYITSRLPNSGLERCRPSPLCFFVPYVYSAIIFSARPNALGSPILYCYDK